MLLDCRGGHQIEDAFDDCGALQCSSAGPVVLRQTVPETIAVPGTAFREWRGRARIRLRFQTLEIGAKEPSGHWHDRQRMDCSGEQHRRYRRPPFCRMRSGCVSCAVSTPGSKLLTSCVFGIRRETSAEPFANKNLARQRKISEYELGVCHKRLPCEIVC